MQQLRIKRLRPLFITLFFLIPSLAMPTFTNAKTSLPANQDQKLTNSIDNCVNNFVKSTNFSGTVLITQNNKVFINKGYGMANLDFNIPNTSNTKFFIGSITKQFTSACIFLLQERKLLNINDTLKKYIPDYPNGNSITIKNLLTHTSGITDYINFKELVPLSKSPYSVQNLIKTFKNKSLEFKPGTKYNYSNSEYILLGYIIEKVSKQSYKDFLVKNVIKPLKLNNTGYGNYSDIIKNKATGYSPVNGKLESQFLDTSWAFSAGALYSTVNDLYAWNNALMSGKVISKASLSQMLTPYTFTNQSNNDGNCCGIFIKKLPVGKGSVEVFYHPGHINGYVSADITCPALNASIIVLCNNDSCAIETICLQLAQTLVTNSDILKSIK